MARIATPSKSWDRWLPLGDFFLLAEQMAAIVPEGAKVTIYNATTRQGRSYQAHSLEELKSDLRDLVADDLTEVGGALGMMPKAMFVFEMVEQASAEGDKPKSNLRAHGSDLRIDAIFDHLADLIERRFMARDRGDQEALERQEQQIRVEIATGDISVAAGGSVSISGTGDATSTATSAQPTPAPPAKPEPSPLRRLLQLLNPWLVAIVGGAIAIIIAGLIVAALKH